MSLSWGTASMATDLAMPHDAQSRRAGIRGRGPHVGARAAASRVRRHHLRGDRAAGYDVEHVAGRVDADLRAWSISPPRTAAWDAQCRQAARIAYRRLQLLIGPKYGVTWVTQLSLRKTISRSARRTIRCCRRSCQGRA